MKNGRLTKPLAATLASASVLVVVVAVWMVGGCSQSSYQVQPSVDQSLNVQPFPGTPAASPKAQITFPSLVRSDLKSIAVDGSSSGLHEGTLTALADGKGTAFIPARAFSPGETVSVEAVLTSSDAGASVGRPGATRISFSFTVAAAPTPGRVLTTTTTAAAGIQPQPATWSFHSRPDLHPPMMTVSHPQADSGSGYVFVDAQLSPQAGPMILDANGDVVWFYPVPPGTWATNVQVLTYHGQPVLTWWQGTVVPTGHGSGQAMILDTSYRPVGVVRGTQGYDADLHEFQITARDTALLTAYKEVQADTSSREGPKDGTVLDCVVQEIDIATGQLMWEWHSLGHVPLSDCQGEAEADGTPYDYFHINSIQSLPDGDLIVSARNTWAIYRIDRGSGAIEWELGGKSTSFKMGPGTQFEWQHDARLYPDGTLTLFNDAAAPKKESQSSGMLLKLDMNAMTASLVSSFTRTPSLLAGSQGSMQVLPNGNVFIGWGDQPNFSEFTADGRLVLDATFPGGIESYRAYRYPWNARPAEPPAVSISTTAQNSFTVYASWNGATGVAAWEVLAGPTPQAATQVIAKVPTTGFETAIPASTPLGYLAVCALDPAGNVIGTTTIAR